MTDIHVPWGEDASDTATLLLAAAEVLELPPEVVRTTSDGFLAPEEVAEKAGLHTGKPDDSEPKPKQTRKRSTTRSDS